ncbi:MAG: hypothetical protein AAGC93_19280 [Cyanobacteria bacterium P01_F01_bin.53]
MVLSSKLQDTAVQESLSADCAQLMDDQVAAKGGLGGMAIKAAYGAIKGIGSDYVPGAIKRLLPEVSVALDPMWDEGVQTGDPVAFLSQNSDRTADLILSTTDDRIERKGSGLIVSTYKKLRKSVKKDVAAAVPDLAQILGKYAS